MLDFEYENEILRLARNIEWNEIRITLEDAL